MKQYQDLVRHVLNVGTRKENRTGVDTLSTFGYFYEHDLREGFPLLTTKAVSWKNIVVEMLWFLSGQTDIGILKRHNCKFWDAWADPETGKVPSAYGNFWRHFPTHSEEVHDSPGQPDYGQPFIDASYNDQIAWVIDTLKRDPMSRRCVVSAWAPGNAQTSKLPPCHSLFVLNVQNDSPRTRVVHYGTNDGSTPVCSISGYDCDRDLACAQKLAPGQKWCHNCQRALQKIHGPQHFQNPPGSDDESPRQRLCLHLTQRSADVALGVPYNIASYALLMHLISRFTGIEPGIFGHTLIDAHVYTKKPDGSMSEYDHVPGLVQQLVRDPRPLPTLTIDESIKTLADVERLMGPEVTTDEIMALFKLEGYDPHPAINFKVAV
jgi:thymidylate synthase